MGGIAGFVLCGPAPPPPAPIRQDDYSSCRRQREHTAKRREPIRPPAGFVVCVCECLSRRVVALVRGAGGCQARGGDLSEIATSRLAPGHSYAVFHSCSTNAGFIQHDGSKLASCAPVAVTAAARARAAAGWAAASAAESVMRASWAAASAADSVLERALHSRTTRAAWRAERSGSGDSWWASLWSFSRRLLLPGSKHSLSAQRDAGSWVWQEQAGGPDGQGWGDVDVVTWTVVAWML